MRCSIFIFSAIAMSFTPLSVHGAPVPTEMVRSYHPASIENGALVGVTKRKSRVIYDPKFIMPSSEKFDSNDSALEMGAGPDEELGWEMGASN
ncbi:hypothetical protein K474DRAFT_1768881 [Panus rudis PR-1116 ss-1]|nr:hypothetical protein K474DRAFT_1768881 [Panus rudis PR-1116 ss-1]